MLHSHLLRRYALYFGIFVGLLLYNIRAYAGEPCIGCPDYSCTLLATCNLFPSGPVGESDGSNPYGPYIYDDASGIYASGGFSGWNCSRQYLFTIYPNAPITFDFSYSGDFYSVPPVFAHDIYVFCKGVCIHEWPAYPDTAGGGDNVFILSYPYDTALGAYKIKYYQAGTNITTGLPDIIGQFVLMLQIQNLWIDASPVCS